MCGRYTLTVDPATLQEAFNLAEPPSAGLTPRYNIAPTQPVAVVPNAAERRLDLFVWGLIPSWAKDPGIGSRMINARAETLPEKPAFRAALKRRRCLVLADGFYEWKPAEAGVGRKGKKTPMHIQLQDGQPFGFAGLWEIWQGADGSLIKSCTIITTAANELVAPIHDRMPVILPPAAYDAWLAPEEVQAEQVMGLLAPYPAAHMKAGPVGTLVNNPAFDTPECVAPIEA